MSSNINCKLCNQKIKTKLPDGTNCKLYFYKDKHTFAILAPEQYTTGHALLILKKHKADITDNIKKDDLSAFIKAIHKVSKRLKKIVRNDHGKRPERIYVCILCDGVKHLHAHLIPRFPFTPQDKCIYMATFTGRDGEDKVDRAIEEGNLGGYWYIAEREKRKSSEFGRILSKDQVRKLEDLAKKLC